MIILGTQRRHMVKEGEMYVGSKDTHSRYFRMEQWKRFGRRFRQIRQENRVRMLDVARAGRTSIFTVLSIEHGKALKNESSLSVFMFLNLARAIYAIPIIEIPDWNDETPFVDVFERQGFMTFLEVKPLGRK